MKESKAPKTEQKNKKTVKQTAQEAIFFFVF